MSSVASKFASLVRMRGIALLVLSVAAAVFSAKAGGPQHMGFWDGPG